MMGWLLFVLLIIWGFLIWRFGVSGLLGFPAVLGLIVYLFIARQEQVEKERVAAEVERIAQLDRAKQEAAPGVGQVARILLQENGLAGDDALVCMLEVILRDWSGDDHNVNFRAWWKAEPAQILAYYRGTNYSGEPNTAGIFEPRWEGKGRVPACIDERVRLREAEQELAK